MPYHDFIGGSLDNATSTHYSDQWSSERGMGKFMLTTTAVDSTMQFVLGWRRLFDEISGEAMKRPVSVYDAACGYGGILHALAAPFGSGSGSGKLTYVGADIREGLQEIELPTGVDAESIVFARHDISEPLPLDMRFDYVVCRNAIHHTPDPRKTFASLCHVLRPGGTIAISAYSKKAIMREVLDDALRSMITEMSNDEALKVAAEFSELGKALRAIKEEVHIPRDLTFLGIEAGSHDVQTLIYNHVVKCWHNEAFGDERSDIVNFDWYHPPYAYRYSLNELTGWFDENGLSVTHTDSHPSQHYVEGVLRT